jgi:DNA-binding HxlR family transcriptional regulator
MKCRIQFTLDIIGSKWALLILRELFTRNRRTHEFLEALPGISTKTLTIRLRELEAYGLVSRHVFPEISLHVEYSLTEKGRELQPVMASLYQVGQRWLQRDDCQCPLNVNVVTKLEHLV